MTTSPMVVFHNDSDSSYANYAGNLSSMSIAANAVTLRFLGQGSSSSGTDAVVLACAAGNEEAVLEICASAMASTRKGMTVIADDKNSVYVDPLITGVTSISVNTGAAHIQNIITTTVDRTLTAAESGSIVNLTDADGVITLPTCAAGLNYTIVLGLAATAGCGVDAGAGDCFYGSIHVQGATDDVSAMQVELITTTSKDKLLFRHAGAATLAGGPGDIIHIIGMNDTSWHVDAQLTTTATASGIAVIV